jgi:L-ascorbate metabolism protein UlaG (beta-lactamase superfamily)
MHPFGELVVPEGRVGIHWFGQNSFAVKDPAGTIVQVDPYFPHDRRPERFIHAEPPLDESQLPTDSVLLTHDHGDHTCVESIQRIHAAFPEARFVGPSESTARIIANGIPQGQVTPLAAGDEVVLGTLVAHAVWSKPPQGVPTEGIEKPDVQHLGYVIVAGEVRLYITGDLINTFADHEELMEPVAQLSPQIGLLTMHPTEGEFPSFEGAVKMALRLGLEAVVPAHYACFAKRTYDPWDFARQLPEDGPRPLIIPYNTSILYP